MSHGARVPLSLRLRWYALHVANEDGARLHALTLRGNFEEALGHCGRLRAEGQEAWAELIEREHALAVGDRPPSRMASHTPTRPGAWRLALFRARTEVTGLYSADLPPVPDHPIGEPMVRAWHCLGRGSEPVDLTEASHAARKLEHPALVVECAALMALQTARAGDAREALRHARRAARMSRTEGLPQSEYLAGVVLARLRRASGHPHLSLRISRSLQQYASPHWHPWLALETVLAGGAASETPATAANALLVARDAASASDKQGLERALAAAREATAGFALLQEDIRAVAALLHPERSAPTSFAEELPFAAFAGDAYVLCIPNEPGRRIRAATLPLHPYPVVEEGELKHRRLATLVAVLGLAGGTVEESECFEQVYGFAYVPDIHRGSFDVLLHRARSMLKDLAEIHRQGDSVHLLVSQPFVVADPRARETTEARLLRALVSGESTARSVAEATGLSVRQAQILLKSLAEGGECDVERRGRALHYKVEDTTFSEPTQV